MLERAPAATVAIIFYNAMPFLPLAVSSVLRQTFRDFELLLIDDGSTDGSLEYARTVADDRVRTYSDGSNKKLNVRLNESVRLARGEYYFRMDADDVMLPDRMERQMHILREVGGEVIVGGGAVSIDKDGTVRGIRRPVTPTRWWAARHAFIHPTVAAQTALLRNNPYSEHFMYHRAQDAELWCRLFGKVRFVNVDGPVLLYREASNTNLENYFATGYGLLTLIYRSDRPILHKLWLGGVELLKVYAYFALSLIRRSKVLVDLRVGKLNAEERSAFQRQYLMQTQSE